MTIPTSADRLQRILATQTDRGAFPSVVFLPDGPVDDENGFVTALVLDALAAAGESQATTAARERALDFLARCEAPDQPGSFRFYPLGEHPSWMPLPLVPDADDTALFSLALVNGGRWPRASLAERVLPVLNRFRMAWVSGAAKPWHTEGCHFTWLDPRYVPNDVDLCANVNVATMAWVADTPAALTSVTAVATMVKRGLDWAGPSAARARLLSPYYPSPAELAHALARAVRLGVTPLRPLWEIARTHPWAQDEDDAPLCSSDDGRIVWRAPVLQEVRALAAEEKALTPDCFL